jgi:hypothetical protein
MWNNNNFSLDLILSLVLSVVLSVVLALTQIAI